MYELVKSGLRRKYVLWFCLITCFILVIGSDLLNISERNVENYLGFSTFVILYVVLSKAHDTAQKFKKENGGNKND